MANRSFGVDDGGAAMKEALAEIHTRAQGWRIYHTRRAIAWNYAYYLIGLPAAALAAVAGATALASAGGRVTAGVIALVSAGIAATATFLDCKSRQGHHSSLSAMWQALANEIRVTILVDANRAHWISEEGRAVLSTYLEREHSLLVSSTTGDQRAEGNAGKP